MTRILILLITSTILFASCKSKQTQKEKQQEIKTGKLSDDNVYTANEVGWTVNIPEGWDVMTSKENDRLNEKGKDILEKSGAGEVDTEGLEQLVNLSKDKFNSFLSTIQPFTESNLYEQRVKGTFGAIRTAYASQNINAEYDEDVEDIDGLRFYRFRTKIFTPDKSKIILQQVMYSRLINGYDFGMTINYNNEENYKTLNEIVRKSQFTKRD